MIQRVEKSETVMVSNDNLERRHAIQNKVKLISKKRGREKALKDNKTDTHKKENNLKTK